MAKRIDTITNSDPTSAAYPVGSFKNSSAPLVPDGTPLIQEWANDIQGLFQRLMLESGKTYSDTADTVLVSQYYDSLTQLFAMKYDTVALMKLANLQVGSVVTTKGYLVAGDLGGATYMIVAPATGTDDGGQFIDLSTNQAQLIPDVQVTSKQYGAVGNGVADDTTQIQNLIDSLFNNILLNTASLITGITIKNNMNIEISETITIANGDLITGTSISNTSIVFLEDGILLGDGVNSDIAILLDGCNNVNVINPIILQFTTAGINKINGCISCKTVFGLIQSCEAGIIIEDTTSLYNEITSVKLNTNNYGLKVLGASSNKIDKVSCIGSVNAGIFLQDKTGGCAYNVFTSCECNDGTGVGVNDGGVVVKAAAVSLVPHDNVFIGQVCNNNAAYGILMFPPTVVIDGTLAGNRFKFTDIVCNGNGQSGVYLGQSEDIQVTNPTCFDNSVHGLETEACNNIKLSGGSFSNNTLDGVRHKSITTIADGIVAENNGRNGISFEDSVDVETVLTAQYHIVTKTKLLGNATLPISIIGVQSIDAMRISDCYSTDFATDRKGIVSAQNGSVITHDLIIQAGYAVADIIIIATPTVAGHFVTITNKTSSSFTISLEDDTGTAIVVNENINWTASLY